MFPHTHILYRDPQLRLDRHGNPAFGRTVQLGQDDACYIRHLHKLPGLGQSVLACGPVQHHQSLPVGVRIFLVNDPVNLFQLFHQILFIVEAARRVADQDVRMAGLGGGHRIEDYRRRV